MELLLAFICDIAVIVSMCKASNVHRKTAGVNNVNKSDDCSSVVKLGAWNIQGLSDKVLQDEIFIKFVNNNDIIVLVETWLKETSDISICNNLYYNYHKIRKPKANARRPSGGISVLIRKNLRSKKDGIMGIQIIKDNDFVVWIKLSKKSFNVANDIYIGAVYIPPENSTIYVGKDNDPFHMLEQDILKFQSLGEIILLGDFNARTGNLQELNLMTIPDNHDILQSLGTSSVDSSGRSRRNNIDTTNNNFGKILLELCSAASLRILNGRTIGDLVGGYTSFQYNGRSVVDYIIAGENLLPLLKTMKVSHPTHLSDHASIETSLCLAHTRVNKVDQGGKPLTSQFSWKVDSKVKFVQTLKNPFFQSRLDKCKTQSYNNVNDSILDLNNIIIDAAKLSLKKKKLKQDQARKDKMGFDGECKHLKKELLHLGNLVKKFPKDPIIYGDFICLKKKFKRMVRTKNRQAKDKLLNLITESQDKNPQLFWKLINKLRESKRENGNPIDISTWQSYFKELHNNSPAGRDKEFIEKISEKLKNNIKKSIKISALDKPFSDDEILSGIKTLKTGKACGPDLILNEMISAGSVVLLPQIKKVFNIILKSESTPKCWSEGFLLPLYKKGEKEKPNNYRGISITSCLGKLFSRLLSMRLLNYLELNKTMSCYQIGFAKNKRTSDHIFVLKCILEQTKAQKKPLYACFVDLKKAFDTVWREGLLYKLLFQCNISTKFIRIVRNMYENIHGLVKTNGRISEKIPLTVGLRQGCNLSPFLFNLYVNDLPILLDKIECDPPMLYNKRLPILMYADDMVLLSTTPTGLQKSLTLLGIYCKRWQLEVNLEKTKIMFFNKRHIVDIFMYNNQPVEIVNKYMYLGVELCKSGSFTNAINVLYKSALRAYFSIRSLHNNCKLNPKLEIKLFDVMAKPILLYCSEILGAFGTNRVHKKNLLSHMMHNNKFDFEKLNIRLCKYALNLPKSASNIACRAELGRIPVMKSILVAVCKYYMRLHSYDDSDLLFHALHSQKELQMRNSVYCTYTEFAQQILKELNIQQPSLCLYSKNEINQFGKKVKDKIITTYKKSILDELAVLRNATDSKLSLYAHLKNDFSYEKYLNNTCNSKELTRFRLSCHWLPIERMRYLRPKPDRKLRICSLCNNGMGTEFHVLYKCKSNALTQLRMSYNNQLSNKFCQFANFDDMQKFSYVMAGGDKNTTTIVCEWIKKVNSLFKNPS